ncbi:hypothetical protein Clacol_007510 [Clathrus columnatus]|uniref:alpha-1,2-Mannosidase n=1 Tax=Clathrus columnatus TaxID=1419009 RepID=A0AAV5AF52_9AGAM|nr:hypothetical protein Clacol_007510 [Clathrus columnatus]
MSEQTLRERRRKHDLDEVKTNDNDNIKASGSVQPSKPRPNNRSNNYSWLTWGIIIGYLALLLYRNWDRLYDFMHPWFGIKFTSNNEPRSVEILAEPKKQEAIIAAFKHAWSAYERDAFGDDEYHPISRVGSNLTKAGGIGYTIVDSIDTMVLMGLEDEEKRARQWVQNNMNLDRDGDFNTFETTIRVLGGLLSAYYLTNQSIYLERATELGDRMLPVFDTPSGIPMSFINLGRREGVTDKHNHGLSSTAEAATLQLEFRYLSYLTENELYWEAVEKVMKVMKSARVIQGLAPIFISQQTGQFVSSDIRLGSRGDSYYEYLLKQHLQTVRAKTVKKRCIMYDDAMDAIHKYLLKRSPREKILYTSELIPERKQGSTEVTWRQVPKQDHLVCFLGGSLMLGATDGAQMSVPPQMQDFTRGQVRDWRTGVDLIKTCLATYETKTGLSPEIVHFRERDDAIPATSVVHGDWYIKGNRDNSVPYDARYILRPETVESLFIAYRLTGNNYYREFGWRIFKSIEKHCKIPEGGYASILHVDTIPVTYEDKMETFLMSETLKYLYLLFSDDSVLPLDKFVFNTEAHPLPIFTPHMRTGFS